MDKRCTRWGLVAGMLVTCLAGRCIRADEKAGDRPDPARKVRAVVVTGGHGFDERNFRKLFDGHADIAYVLAPQKDHSELFEDVSGWKHDVIVLYNMTQRISERRQRNFLTLLEKGVGVVAMHHTVAAFQDWAEFKRIIGVKFHLRPYEEGGVKRPGSAAGHGPPLRIHVEDPDHPITKGISDFQVQDETYRRQSFAVGNHLLLSTDHKANDKPVAWVRTYGKARVFTIQLGHDKNVYLDRNCQRIVAQGIRWAAGRLPLGDLTPAVEEGFVPLFNGNDLAGWQGDKKLWVVENGMLIGRSPGIRYNDFLATTKAYGDFVLRFQVRLVGGKGNSGVQFRSKRVPNSHEVSGYQADIAKGWWGLLYDESRRNRPLVRPKAEAVKKAVKLDGWNDYEVRAVGSKIALTINGVRMVEYTEEDPEIPRTGIIATQVHSGGPLEVRFRNIRIRQIEQTVPRKAPSKG